MDKEIYEMGKEIFNYLKDNFKIYTVEECKELKDKGAYGFIYITQCKVNSKLYIGQKKFNYGFETYLGSGVLFTRAVDKYGKENFERIILQIAYSQEELDNFEIKYIELFEASKKDNNLFYNIALGGSGACLIGEDNPNYGKSPSEETRKKISEANKGKKRSEEQRRKMSEVNKKRSEETRKKLSEANKGKKRSEETRKKISESHKGGKYAGENNPNYGNGDKVKGIKNGQAKSLVCLFPSGIIIKDVCMRELSEELGISPYIINNMLNLKQPYKVAKSTKKSDLEHLKSLEGIIIMEEKDYLNMLENTNINDDKAS